MNERDFCFWLQGFAEMRDVSAHPITNNEWKMICEHLKLVMNKQTSEFNILDPDVVYDVPTAITC